MFVYLITNNVNGKKYVGQHIGEDLQRYFKNTIYFAEAGYQGKRLLYRAIRKHGSENFSIKPLVIVGTKWEMDLYESGMIKAWDTQNPEKGYNLTAGGDGTVGFCPDEETRAKMSKAREGKKMSEENRLKFIERIKGNKFGLGRKMTADNFGKLMAVHIGAKRTDEARQRMSDAHKGIPWSDLQREASHVRWHVKRNIIKSQCEFCNKDKQCPSSAV
jgi:group I intron endonuclease